MKFQASDAVGGGLANNTVVFVALSYGIGLLTSAWVLYRVSGGLFNPALTLGLVLAGALPPMRGLILFPAQVLGATCAAAVVSCIAPIGISVVQSTLAPDTSIAQGVFLEMVSAAFRSRTLEPVAKLFVTLTNLSTVPDRLPDLDGPHAGR